MKFVALFLLAVMSSVVIAAPATQPTPKAAERAKTLKEAAKSFRMDLFYHGDQDKPYYFLTLSVGPVAETATSPFHLIAGITEEQATQVIAHLAVEGFLDQATDAANKKIPAPATPGYTMSVWSGNEPQLMELYDEMGWGMPLLKRLDGLRAVLNGDAAQKMDQLLGRLSGHRKEWEKQAGADHPSLKISIAVPERNIVAARDEHSHFHVVIENVSSAPQNIIDEWNSWGYFNLRFEYTTASGEKKVMEKQGRDWSKNFLTSTTLKPGESTVWDVFLSDTIWSNLPVPEKGEAKVRIQAVFEQKAEAGVEAWHGRILSSEQEITIRNLRQK